MTPIQQIYILLMSSVLFFFAGLGQIEAHQAISFPYPISRYQTCRVGNGVNCRGPCPRKLLRGDMNPNNPSVTVPRGNWVKIGTQANNHRGGFNRWSLVHVKDMQNHSSHRERAFLFSCGDTWMTNCTRRNRKRDCNFDRQNVHFLHKVQIPKIYPDGMYVLGWVWYGWANTNRSYGSFGDYYDCMYVRVKGGPAEDSHSPIFKAGKPVSGKYGMCQATVNKMGVCWKEPCPDGGPTQLQRPYEFIGRKPKPLKTCDFLNPYVSKSRSTNSPIITSMAIRSADNPEKVYTNLRETSFPYLNLTKSMRTTVTCDMRGKVEKVVFYDNGERGVTNYSPPYSIAGEWRENGIWKFAPWKVDIDRTVTTISCQAVGFDGAEHWKTIELSTDV